MCEPKRNETIMCGIRGVLSFFFAFWVMVVGVHLIPRLDTVMGPWLMLFYLISIIFSAVFIILNGVGIFDN